MPHVSKIDTPIIDSLEELDLMRLKVGPVARGYVPRDYQSMPQGTAEFCSALPPDFYIPRKDWPALIEEKEGAKATLSDIRKRKALKTKYQNGWGYCWAFGTVNAVRLVRAANNLPNVDLSATAIAAQIKGYRNQGGNTWESIKWISTQGIPEARLWPECKVDQRLATAELKANAQQNILREWYELPSNDFDAMASCLLRDIPVIAGQTHWNHMIVVMTLRRLANGGYGGDIWNSWGESYGDDGVATLTERMLVSFDQAAPRVVTANQGSSGAAAPLQVA